MLNDKTVLPDSYSKGPLKLGDPDDKRLRKLEIRVLISKQVREKAKYEKCKPELDEIAECCKGSQILYPFLCRKQVKTYNECCVKWFNDPQLNKECTDEYLEKRSEFRRTGVGFHY